MAEVLPEAVERAKRDYLAVSKSRDLYASPHDYQRAEAQAWEKLQAAIALWDTVREAV